MEALNQDCNIKIIKYAYLPVLVLIIIHYLTDSCNMTYEQFDDTILSKNYPDNYENNMHCFYTIEQPEGITIQLELVDANLQEAEVDDDGQVELLDYIQVHRRRVDSQSKGNLYVDGVASKAPSSNFVNCSEGTKN